MIRMLRVSDKFAVASMVAKLWPSQTEAERAEEIEELFAQQDAAVFLCFAGEVPVGFAQCKLRRDYVEGTSTSPVGYLEAVFVEAPYRKQGYGKALVAACEQWAKAQGCTEFASDCEWWNSQSLSFHLRIGFAEANRIICFTKKL